MKKISTIKWNGMFAFQNGVLISNKWCKGHKSTSHAIKVQYLNSNELLCTKVVLTLIVSNIIKVLNIENLDSYIKWPTSLMIIVEITNINWLTNNIHIPLLDEKVELDAIVS
jgi:hypothetical protein